MAAQRHPVGVHHLTVVPSGAPDGPAAREEGADRETDREPDAEGGSDLDADRDGDDGRSGRADGPDPTVPTHR